MTAAGSDASDGAAVIDAHHHLWPADVIGRQDWRPEHDQPIRRAFGPEELAAEYARAGVTGSVLMQSVDDAAENERLFRYADRGPFIRGVVAWAPLASPAAASAVIDDLVAARERGAKLSGVRCLVGTDPMKWAVREEGLRLFQRLAAENLTWDVVPITDEQAANVAEVARAVPDLRIVVNHLAAPPLTDDGWEGWTRRIDRLAAGRNVAIKLSVGVAVLTRWRAWDIQRLRPYLERALEAFGPGRSMLASNWPVVLLRADFARAWTDTRNAALMGLTPEQQASVQGGTAARWYRLAEPAE
jgi:L-fuconolactonase